MKDKTLALDPPMKFVPYMVVNGKFDDDVEDEIQENLLAWVCRNYHGENKSEECNKIGGYAGYGNLLVK